MKVRKKIVFLCASVRNSSNSTRFQRLQLLTDKYDTALIYKDAIPEKLKKGCTLLYKIRFPLLSQLIIFTLLVYLRYKGYKVIHTQYNIYAIWIGYLSKKILGYVWIYDLWDHPSLEYQLSTNRYLACYKDFIFNSFLKYTLSSADCWIIAMNQGILKYMPSPSRETLIIKTTNGVDIKYANNIREQYVNNTKFELSDDIKVDLVICYVGHVTLQRGIGFILDWIRQYTSTSYIKIIFAGIVSQEAIRAISNYTSDQECFVKIELAGLLSHSATQRLIMCSDICLCILDRGVINYQFAYPIKIFEYMALSRVVLASRTKATEELIADNYSGILIENNVISMNETINRLLHLKKNRTLSVIGSNARRTVERYSWDIINNRLEIEIDKLIRSRT